MGILVSDFFRESYKKQVDLKWPNDLIYKSSKCGGVIMKLVGEHIVCGLGINLVECSRSRSYKAGHLFDQIPISPQEMALNIYRYILQHRQGPSQISQKFSVRCVHLGADVVLKNHQHGERGVFKGINLKGGAVLQTGEGEKVYYSGHLRYQ